VVFVPTVPGQFVIPTYRNGEVNNQATTYFALTGRSPDGFQPTESLAQQIGGILQIQAIFTRTTAAPGSGAQWAYTLRDNGANTSLNTTTSGASFTSCMSSAPVTGCASGSPVTVNNFDLLDTAATPTGSPALSEDTNGVSVSYLAYVPQLAFTTEPPATGTAGTALSPVVVEVQDANGNPITGSTAQVTIGSSPAGVGGTVTATAVNGVATFNNLVFTTTGSYTLSATVSGLTAVSSSSISIGAGSAPVASLTASLSFPNTVTGTTSAALAATLSNTGNAALNNIVASITGSNRSDFALTTGANACGATLAAGSSCSIYVIFTPASAASFSATLSVADNASGSPQTAALSGTGTAPIASLSPALAFPNTLTGATSPAMTATLSNTGTAPLNNIVASIAGTNSGDFAIATGANACGATLAAGWCCSIYVTFTPASAAGFSATLSVADNASGSPQTVTLSGAGMALSVTETSAASFTIGQWGATYTVTVSNGASAGSTSGTVTLTETLDPSLTLVSMSGTGWACTGAVCTRSDALAAGASYPAVTVAVNVSLIAPASATSQATVSGGGSVPATASDVTSISPQATTNFTLTNQGPDAVSFSGILLTGESYTNNVAQTNNCPATIGVGASCNFNLTFNTGSPIAAPDWAQFGQYAAADQQLIAGAPNPSRLVFIGDSITLNWDQPAPFGEGSLQAVQPYVNRGIVGQTTEQMLVRFQEDVVKLSPAVVQIFGGTNDLAGNTGPETNAEIIDQLTSMTLVAKANGIKVLIGSVTPVVNLTGGTVWTTLRPNSQIVALNQSIQALCQQTGAVYVDYYSALVNPATGAMNVNLTVDGLQPNTAGYSAMVPVVQQALATLGY
jgi:uncharacterized repeat protein (TIGR01451 family)